MQLQGSKEILDRLRPCKKSEGTSVPSPALVEIYRNISLRARMYLQKRTSCGNISSHTFMTGGVSTEQEGKFVDQRV